MEETQGTIILFDQKYYLKVSFYTPSKAHLKVILVSAKYVGYADNAKIPSLKLLNMDFESKNICYIKW